MISYRQITIDDAEQLKNTALKSWIYTYRHIYQLPFIHDFINNNYSPEALQRSIQLMKKGESISYIASDGNKLVGFMTVGVENNQAKLYRIYLDPDYIGKGIGTKLLKLGEHFMYTKSIKYYSLYVHKDNELGKRFYKTHGFIHNEIKDQDDEWYMEKQLLAKE